MENPKKNPKNSKNAPSYLIFLLNHFFNQKFLKNIFCCSMLGIHNSTRALQSSHILRQKSEKSLKKSLFLTNLKIKKKKWNKAIILVFQLMRLVFGQSSPVHPISESRGDGLSVTHGRTNNRRKSSSLISDVETQVVTAALLSMLVQKTQFQRWKRK